MYLKTISLHLYITKLQTENNLLYLHRHTFASPHRFCAAPASSLHYPSLKFTLSHSHLISSRCLTSYHTFMRRLPKSNARPSLMKFRQCTERSLSCPAQICFFIDFYFISSPLSCSSYFSLPSRHDITICYICQSLISPFFKKQKISINHTSKQPATKCPKTYKNAPRSTLCKSHRIKHQARTTV